MQVFIPFLNQKMMKAQLYKSFFCDQCHEKKNAFQPRRQAETEAADDFAFRPKTKSWKKSF